MVDTGVYSFFGYRIPANVKAAETRDPHGQLGKKIFWQVHGSNTIHEMDFPHATEENILAVLAAMRLSC